LGKAHAAHAKKPAGEVPCRLVRSTAQSFGNLKERGREIASARLLQAQTTSDLNAEAHIFNLSRMRLISQPATIQYSGLSSQVFSPGARR
jgi:hypothetical protein